MASKEAADRLAPPIRNPFTPGAAASSAAFSGRTEPPYRIRSCFVPDSNCPTRAQAAAQS